MKVITFHSVKGGTGKTTLALCLAKYLALSGAQVLLVDLDFLGTGLPLSAPEEIRYLEDYLRADDQDSFPVRDMITDYSDRETKFSVVHARKLLSPLFDPALRECTFASILGREREVPFMTRCWNELLPRFAHAGYDYVIGDCHMGLSFLSGNLFREEEPEAEEAAKQHKQEADDPQRPTHRRILVAGHTQNDAERCLNLVLRSRTSLRPLLLANMVGYWHCTASEWLSRVSPGQSLANNNLPVCTCPRLETLEEAFATRSPGLPTGKLPTMEMKTGGLWKCLSQMAEYCTA